MPSSPNAKNSARSAHKTALLSSPVRRRVVFEYLHQAGVLHGELVFVTLINSYSIAHLKFCAWQFRAIFCASAICCEVI